MTPLEMLDAAMKEIPNFGPSKFTTLVIPYRRHRGKIQVLKGRPSLYGTVVGSQGGKRHWQRAHDDDRDGATLIVSVQCADVIRWFRAHLSSLEGTAIEAAEAGDYEKARYYLTQYEAVRDRLSSAPGAARGNL